LFHDWGLDRQTVRVTRLLAPLAPPLVVAVGLNYRQHAAETGGLSGAPVLEASNRVIRQLRAALGRDYPIIGVGGILSAEDALSKIDAGADLVQIYTGLIYRGPELVRQSAEAIKNRLQANIGRR